MRNDAKRCSWVKEENQLYVEYHDTEWGVPTTDDKILFEFMILESAQAGLSWEIILKKREGYRRAFKRFNPKLISKMIEEDVKRLLNDDSIVRNRLKIEATINNANRFIKIQKEFGSFSKYMWAWVDGKPIQNNWRKTDEIPAITDLAIEMSKDLKKRGFTFLGQTTWYAYMQAVGMVNDHTTDCFCSSEIKRLGMKLKI